jgi:PilZ domain
MPPQQNSAQQVPFKVKTIAYMGHRQLVCVGLSLSCEGMQIYAPVQEKLGQYIRLVFSLGQDQWLDVDALLISQTRRKEHYLWGLSFINVSVQAGQQLAAFVERGKAPPDRRQQRSGTSRYRVVRRVEERSGPIPERDQRHVGYRTGTEPAVRARQAPAAPPRQSGRQQDVPLPEPAFDAPAAEDRSFDDEESTPLEEIYRRALEDLERSR